MYVYLETTYSSLNTLWLSCSIVSLILRRLRQKLKNVDDYLHQRMPLNSVQSLKLQRRRYVHFEYNRMHLTAWLLTISVITAGLLNVNSWLSMSLRFISSPEPKAHKVSLYNIMRQSACLVFNPITVNNFASLFNCRPVGRASDSMMAPT